MPADGYTTIAGAPHPFFAGAVEDVPFTLEDFTSVGLISNLPCVLVVRADSPYNSIADVVAQLKKEPRSVITPVVGLYGIQSVILGVIEQQDGVEFSKPPSEGGGPNAVALLGGHVDMTADPIAAALPYFEAGQFKAIAVTSGERSKDEFLEDVPTFVEQGYDFQLYMWVNWMVRADTPAPVLEKLRAAYWAVMDDPSYLKLTARMGLTPAHVGGEDADVLIRESFATNKAVILKLKAAAEAGK